MCHFGDSQVISEIFAKKLFLSFFYLLENWDQKVAFNEDFPSYKVKKKQDLLWIYKVFSPPYCVYMGFLVRLLENRRFVSGKGESPLVKVNRLDSRISPGKRPWADLNKGLTSFPVPYWLTYLLPSLKFRSTWMRWRNTRNTEQPADLVFCCYFCFLFVCLLFAPSLNVPLFSKCIP